MNERHPLIGIAELIIFLAIGYFVYQSHGWALAVSVTLIAILLLGVQGMCRNIINRLSILYDKVERESTY